MTNTATHIPQAHFYVNSACKLRFKMARDGEPRLYRQGEVGRLELVVLDPEGAVQIRIFRLTAGFPIETGHVDVSNLTVPQFEALLHSLVVLI